MLRLDDLALFVRAAALGSFSDAAREVDLLPGQASAAIARLEKQLAIRLFARSTRSLRLTDEGERYLPFAIDALAALQGGHDTLRRDEADLAGTLQLAAPSDLGRNVLLPLLSTFRRAHPRLDLRLLLSDQVTDVFRDPVDIAIRYGHIDDASFVALPLAPGNRRVLVASPAYLTQHGAPPNLDALAQRDCLLFQLQGKVYDKWLFPDADGGRALQVRATLAGDDGDVVRRWAIAGEGIAYKSWLDVCADVRSGALVVLLPELPGEAAPLNLICPHRRQFSPAVRQLHILLADHFHQMGQGAPHPDTRPSPAA
jgi:DNA-binding transcriptional LysR family regulator